MRPPPGTLSAAGGAAAAWASKAHRPRPILTSEDVAAKGEGPELPADPAPGCNRHFHHSMGLEAVGDLVGNGMQS